MPGFWNIPPFPQVPAAIDARSGRQWSYAELHEDAGRLGRALPQLGRKTLGLILAQNRYECVAAYLAALQSGSAAVLLDATLNAGLLHDFVALYAPDWIFATSGEFAGYRAGAAAGLLERVDPVGIEIHPDLALLLSTSGSTGSPKLVRLTLANLEANAASIAEYLGLTPQERPITSLPMSYSYGLSILNSHLHAGAALVLSEHGVLRREFWDAVDRFECTSFAGVPYTYQMLLQTGLLNKRGATLKTLTQAGGRLDERYIQQMHALATASGRKFFVMYGQTEAAPRISYVPSERLGEKIGSVGVAVPGGALRIDAHTGELIYEGPNVMLGYAESRADLARGDEQHGVLHTGDLARRDEDGYFYIVGRLKRFLKLFGKRFNLDDVERVLARQLEATVACWGRDDLLAVAVERSGNAEEIARTVCETFDLPKAAVQVTTVEEVPRTANGKFDYQRLAAAGRDHTAAAIR